MGGHVLQVARGRMGEILAREAPVDADLVIAVPDSGNAAARGFARAAGLPQDDGFVKNRYVARTFIQPGQELRKHGLRLKFNPLPEIVGGKRLVVVDDSIVRGNTTRQIVQMLRDAGAAEVHMRISAPPIKHPCHYGIDMSTREEMIAHGRTVERDRRRAGRRLAGTTCRWRASTRPSRGDARAPLRRLLLRRLPAGRQRRGGREVSRSSCRSCARNARAGALSRRGERHVAIDVRAVIYDRAVSGGSETALALELVATMTSVLAYLDPGSGSMILQILAGGVAAVGVAAKMYWRRTDPVPAPPQGRARGRRRPRSPRCPRPAPAPGPPGAGTASMATLHAQPSTLEPGSFRDPDSRVFYAGDAVYRALSSEGLDDFRALAGERAARGPAHRRHRARGRRPRASGAAGQGDGGGAPARADPVRLLSRTSGRSRCSRTPRCSSSTCCSPRSSATSSSRTPRRTTCSSGARGRCSSTSARSSACARASRGSGYRQFCMLYLYPLLLQALKGVRFQPWLRGSLDGITAGRDARPDVVPRSLPPRAC